MNPKIVLIGSGSQFTEFFLQELFKYEDFRGCTLALVDRKPARLEHEMKMAEALNRAVDWDVHIEGTGDRRKALAGAQYVYIFAAVNQGEAWPKEYELAKKYGYTTLEGYTNGPASIGTSIRHVPLVLDICSDMEELCPDAWMILCNNPIPKLQAAVTRHSKTKCVGYCNGHELIDMALEQLLEKTEKIKKKDMDAGIVEREFMVPKGNLILTLAGVNHFQWILHLRDAQTGEDLYDLLRKQIEKSEKIPNDYAFSAELTRVFGLFPSPGDLHIMDVTWFADRQDQINYNIHPFNPADWFGMRQAGDWEVIAKKYQEPDAGKKFIHERRTGWMYLQIARFLMHGEREYFPALNLENNGAISNLSDEIVVEVPTVIGGNRIEPIHVGPLPDGIATMCEFWGRLNNLIADGAAEGSKEKMLQALMIDPFVKNMETSKKLLDEILEYNQKYDTRFV
jgi:alpha-galactosidase